MKKEQILKELKPNWNAQVYYDPKTHILFTLHGEIGKDRIRIGGVAGYYNSAITCLFRYSISREYFKQCIPVNKESPELTSTEYGLKVKGYDPIANDFWYKYIYRNPDFVYLNDTDELVAENRKLFGDWD